MGDFQTRVDFAAGVNSFYCTPNQHPEIVGGVAF